MSELVDSASLVSVSISDWIERAKPDPSAYLERKATEVLLTAIGRIEPYSHQMFLKGGILMGVLYDSPRQTADIDFSTTLEPEVGIAEEISSKLNSVFPSVTAELGYPDLVCSVQSVKYSPKGEKFPKYEGPAIKMKVGYAVRGSSQERHLNAGQSVNVLEIDISFREPIGSIQIILFQDTQARVQAYSLIDLIAEKIRAFLQQEKRDRHRRQDVYDLHALLLRFALNTEEKAELLKTIRSKCSARGIDPTIDSFEQPALIDRARDQWNTMELEIGKLPEFEECYKKVKELYRELPW